ncbi:MAG: heavy metal-associated domain-containing protein [Bacteroidales bacterium]|nr:heavy metal-associated domain-containing protein [Bacteroidales bacterium]
MKKLLLLIPTLMLLAFGGKNIHTLVVTVDPQMHCESCENKIKGNLRYEKGVTKIVTSLQEQTVTITYHADKTNPDAIVKAFAKIGYKATIVSDKPLNSVAKKSKNP